MIFQESLDVIAEYADLCNGCVEEDFHEKTICIPQFNDETLNFLISKVTTILHLEPTLLKISGPLVVVGDIHGNIRDMLRIIHKNGFPNTTKYLFMGDYVDRGDYSIEVLTFLFALKISFPDRIYILRGNHECESVNEIYGFKTECLDKFGNLKIYNLCQRAFDEMPLAAIVDEKIFCVHGGISSNMTKVSQIQTFIKPINIYSPKKTIDITEGLLWSDPNSGIHYFDRSYRGRGQVFGRLAISSFLSENNLEVMIRAHSCVKDGYSIDLGRYVYTVFSSGYYQSDNKPGYLLVDSGSIMPCNLQAVPQLKRKIIERDRNHCLSESSLPPLSPGLRGDYFEIQKSREEVMIQQKRLYELRRAKLERNRPQFPPNIITKCSIKKPSALVHRIGKM